ncbi:MAG: hypothetical protein ACRD6X_21390, partial [Pyrinomonadaceae bacterium]
MNVFEDLIGELKDENLLEDTVIDVKKTLVEDEALLMTEDQVEIEQVEFETNTEVPAAGVPEFETRAGDREFFRKRAVDEVASLQMVEHVLSGVEREHMKVPAAPYDDLEVKKALHIFLQAPNDENVNADAEYKLLQETQGWHAALYTRDKGVSVSNIRRFCENSRPILSSNALMALARFYRNSPFSEDVRTKFEYVMTRLFARDAGNERRQLLFSRKEMIGHIRTLYANWSSINYHTAEENRSEIDLSVQCFDDLVKHFEAVESFDELLNADVFNTVRQYKEECGELFFTAETTAAAIECNIRLGNKYVFLIVKEKKEVGSAKLEEKYGFQYDQIASNAAGKTLVLEDLLNGRPANEGSEEGTVAEFEQESFDIARSVPVSNAKSSDGKESALAGVNRWLVAATILVALVSGGMYFWADKIAGSDSAVLVADEVELGGTDLKPHLRTMRTSNGTAYGVTEPSWDAMSEDDKKEFLKKAYEFARSKGQEKVNLLNYKGRT